MSTLIGVAIIALLVVLAMTGVLHLNPVSIAQKMSLVIVGLALAYFIYLFAAGGLTPEEKKRVIVIFLLFIFASIFWSAFEQAPTSLNLFARDYTNRVVFGWEMPTLWLQAANSVFVIALAPVFADLNKYAATMPFLGQSTILSLTDDQGTGAAYCLAHHLTIDGDKRRLMVAALRYYDTFVKMDGSWLFAERLLYVDWMDERALS